MSFQSSHKIESPPQTLLVEPIVGTYHVKLSTRCQDGKVWSRELPIIGTVVTNNSGVLEMNGEPFIVKGVNVHGMISDSPERNRHLQRFLKDIGFNMLRGDYPPPWQVEMAGEENIGYMVLAPFSVTHTDLLKERHGERAFPKMREVSRRFIRTYRDLPAVWLWNSCNEIEGELDDFLVTLHPLYRALDPADRPVVYANLFGQDRTLGMDVMAVNYYYGPPQMARDRWPLIQRSIEESRKAKVPCIYTEYNCWYGPVYSRGVESVEDFFVKGIEWGMQGGFQFMLPDHPDRHPGVIDTRERLRTNPTYLASLKDAFADAELEPVSRERGSILLSIRNRRPFTLRKVRYRIEELGRVLAEGELRDIEPHGSGRIPRILDKGGEGRILRARIDFETHHGLRCKVEDELRLPAAQR
ncbi:MAG: hypothetical protein HUU16_01300 [Candidatus Omnitrophica bacterium]|nr:hypothetical protein [Candidatus Omnitrophota bacterium]